MVIIVSLTVVLGIWSAFFLVGNAIVNIGCPYQRVAYYWTILAALVTAVILGHIFLGSSAFYALATFALTLCGTWIIMMDYSKMVHFNTTE